MKVTVPSRVQHEGIFSMTVEIQDSCPKCGAKRGIKRWQGFSYDGSRRLPVDCWSNECNHIDLYSDISGIPTPIAIYTHYGVSS